MAELGVAGSAVGIISLGVQVCQGLTKYYESWKDAPKAVTNVCKSVRNLKETLKVLSITIKDKGVATQAEMAVQNNIDACAASIAELQDELLRFQEIRGSKIWSKVHGQGRRLLYPFRESTLLKLKEIVADIRENLSLTVEALQLQDIANSREQLEYTSSQLNNLITYTRSYHKDQESMALVDWLSPLNFFVKQNDTLCRRQEGTAEWIFETPEFEAWLAGTDKILWCSGLPGAGKTILASAIIDKLQTRFNFQNVGLAFIYFNYKERETQTLANIIASLVQQLLLCYSSIPDEIKKLYNDHKPRSTRPSGEEFLKILQSLIPKFSHIYVVVDALDECTLEIRNKFIDKLRESSTNLHLLCTSRHLGDIQEAFVEAPRLEIRAKDSDIAQYVEAQIVQVPKLVKFCKKAGDLQNSMIEKLVEKANGMFLLAELHLKSLKTKTDIRSLRKALDALPEEQDEVYKEALERIQNQPEDESKLAMRVLSWITHAVRPLKVEEIQHAVAVMNLDPEDAAIDEEGLSDETELITVCGGIVIIDQNSRVIRLVHYTTQEYFNRTRGEWFPNAESEIATTCVTYLLFDVFESGICQTEDSFNKRLRSNKFFEYSTQNWGYHARIVAIWDLALSQAVIEFLRSDTKVAASSQGLLLLNDPWEDVEYIPNLKGVHLAAYLGIEMAMRLLLESGTVDANSEDSFGQTSLIWAAKNGHEAVVRLLLEKGAKIESKDDDYGQTPLSWAAKNGHEAIIRLLLEKGAEIESKDNIYGQTPLSLAAENGHEAIVMLLLEKGAKIESKGDNYGQTPLSWAAENGHEATARLLLEKGAKPNLKDNDGRTILSWAAEGRHEAIVKLLLENGVDPNVEDNKGWTALSYAVKKGRETIAQLLRDAGAVDSD